MSENYRQKIKKKSDLLFSKPFTTHMLPHGFLHLANQPCSIHFVEGHSLPLPRYLLLTTSYFHTNLAESALLLTDLSFSPSSSCLFLERTSSVILSGCITYRAIKCLDRDLGTRAPIQSERSIILSPRNAPSVSNLIGQLRKKVRKIQKTNYARKKEKER